MIRKQVKARKENIKKMREWGKTKMKNKVQGKKNERRKCIIHNKKINRGRRSHERKGDKDKT